MSRTRQLSAFAVICVCELLIVLDMTIINVALPQIGIELETSITGLQWVVDAYTLTFSGFLLAFGNLGDRYGRKLMLAGGLAGLGLSSIIGVVADDMAWVLVSRALMGFFAAAVLPATLAIITTIFPDPKEKSLAIGIWSSIAGVAVAIGPISGGYLLTHFSWHSVFWLNVPVAAVAVFLVWRLVPNSKAASVGRLDWPGVILSIAGISIGVFAIIEAPRYGWLSATTLLGFGLSVVLLLSFIRRELTTVSPVLDMRLFRIRPFALPALAIAVGYFSLFGFLFLITQYFQGVREYTPLAFGIATLPFAAALAVSAPTATVIAQKVGTMPPLVLGLLLIGAGLIVGGQVELDSSYLTLVLPAMILLAVGIAIIQGPATESIMSSVPLDEAGAGSAINDTTREIGGTLGVAVIGSIASSYYLTHVRTIVDGIPAGLMNDTEKDYARSSVLSVLQIRERDIPAFFDPTRNALIDQMKQAALTGSAHASYLAAGAVFVCAIVVAIGLPRRYRTSGIVGDQVDALAKEGAVNEPTTIPQEQR
ncbi:MAG: MFS transporter [Corynebacteriales bacterium]|nr:MFS transporter [Mycobacteriales bacterium]